MDEEHGESAEQLEEQRAFWRIQFLSELVWIGAQLGLIWLYVETIRSEWNLLWPTLMIPLTSLGLGLIQRLFINPPLWPGAPWLGFKDESTTSHIERFMSLYRRATMVSLLCFLGWGVVVLWHAGVLLTLIYELLTQGLIGNEEMSIMVRELQRAVPLLLVFAMHRIHFRFFLANKS